MVSNKNKGNSGQSRITVITVIIMILIISIMTIARRSLNIDEKNNSPDTTNSIKLFDEKGLNEPEKNILMMIYDWAQLPDQSKDEKNDIDTLYLKYLKEHSSSSGVALDNSKADEIEDLIISRNKIMDLENADNLQEMSYDGSEITIYIYQQIYKLCGLELTFDTETDIAQIVNPSGEVIYQKNNPVKQSGFHVDALVITLSSLILLFGICMVITRKNQLFLKGGRYDGFDEKKYA